jgi:enterobacterial common antigen flippase
MLQVVSWPIGFLLRVKGDGKLYFVTELFAGASFLSFAWLGLKVLGLPGAGAALLAMNVCYLIVIYLQCEKNTNSVFQMSRCGCLLFSIALVAASIRPSLLPKAANLVSNILMTIIIGRYALKVLISRTKEEKRTAGDVKPSLV